MAEVTWEEAARGEAAPTEEGVSWKEAMGSAVPAKVSKPVVSVDEIPPKRPPRTMIDFLGQTAANLVSGADMVASMPAWLLGMPVDAGARLLGMAMSPWSGESRREVAQGGLSAKHKVMEALGNPLQKIAQMTGGEQAYEGSHVSQGMSAFGELAERAGGSVEEMTGGRILKEDYLSMLDPAMAGVAPGVGRMAARPPAPPPLPSLPVQFSGRARAEPYVEPPVSRLDPAQGPKRPLSELLSKERALDERLAKQGPDPEPGVATTYEPKAKPPPSTTSSDVIRAMRKPAFERTAEDLLAIKEARDKALVVGGLGAVAALMDDEEAMGGVTFAMAAGAVKGKGGNWLDSTLSRVNPFRDYAAPTGSFAAAIPKAMPTETFLGKAGDRYFKTHFGAESDPLKDVKLPSGRTWSEAAEKVIRHSPAEDLRMQEMTKANPWLEKVPPDERVYFIDPSELAADGALTGRSAAAEVKSFMHHVADYLRQNVPPEKLAQYDLPRAVRETVADDARMAREMERASAASTAELPVHKAYEDGVKWVEIKLPEKLTEEQARGVERLTDGKSAYVALDSEGKPLRNNYTKEKVTAATPEEAWLAGQLAREGNAMGHCVGGYCDPVASGETRIFSLRDTKGQPHVTVEVVSKDRKYGIQHAREAVSTPGELGEAAQKVMTAYEQYLDAPLGDKVAYNRRTNDALTNFEKVANRLDPSPPAIEQIKGKQNRAPNYEYLPYVQDFVKSGKWADVGDLEGTGLRRWRGGYETQARIDAAIKTDIEPLAKMLYELPESIYYKRAIDAGDYKAADKIANKAIVEDHTITDLQGVLTDPLAYETGILDNAIRLTKKLLKERKLLPADEASLPPASQRGAASPELLKSAAAVGAGAALLAYLDPENKGTAALLGGGLGLVASRVSPKGAAAAADKGLGLVSTRVMNISPALHRRWNEFEHGLLSRIADARSAVDPFLVRANRKGLAANSELSRAILTNDAKRVNAAIQAAGDPALDVAWRAVRRTLDDIGQQLQRTGRVTKLLTDYFPRIVKDREGLLNALAKNGPGGIQAKTHLESLLAKAEAQALKTRGTGLTELEQSKIINNYLLAPLRQGSQPIWAKKRSIPEITAELEPFYLNITDALHSYLRSASMELEKNKFFGRDAQVVNVGGQQHINVDASIGNVVQRLLDNKDITHAQAIELNGMLKDRFGPGERMSRAGVQDLRNTTNALLLGNPLSAGTQFGDVLMAAAVQGLKPTLRAVGLILTGRGTMRPRDVGLINHISEEFVSSRRSAKFLQSMLKWSGFSLVDSFGKSVNLQAARLKYEKLAQTPKGQAEIQAKYGEAYGAELPQLLAELASRQLTPLTRSFYFGELARVQPISKFETTQAYLANADPGFGPMDARSLYQLKSFMLKQADLLRREGYNEIKKGNKTKGYYKLAAIGALLGLSGALPDMVKDFLMGKPFSAEWSDIPLNMLKTFGWSQYTMDKARSGKLGEVAGSMVIPPFRIFEQILNRDPKAIQYLPLVGKILYAQEWEEGGKERGRKKRQQEELRKIDRKYRPVFGKPSAAALEEIKARKRLVRELGAR